MKTAEQILNNLYYSRQDPEINFDELVKIINEVRIEALTEACNVVKTYKVSNSGSWMDAGVDREPITNLIKQCLKEIESTG